MSEKTCPGAVASVRLRRMGRLLVTLVLAAVAMPAAGAPVRIFAVGHKQRLADAVTYETYRDKMTALMDATFPPPRWAVVATQICSTTLLPTQRRSFRAQT